MLPLPLSEDAVSAPHFSRAPPKVGAGEGPEGGGTMEVMQSAAVRLLADLVHHSDPANKAAAEAAVGTPGTLQYVDCKNN